MRTSQIKIVGSGFLTVACVAVALVPSMARAEVTANFGWVSEYIFRGIPQDDSSAYLGVDYEKNGFYVGSWAADVGQGAEVDFYFGYQGEIGDALNYGIGATGYFYTDDFDDTYREVNLSFGYEFLSFNAAFGQYDNFGGPTQDYGFATITGNYNDFYALVGSFAQDFDGEYIELGYSTDVSGLDLSVALIHSTSDLVGDADTAIVFGVGKTVGFDTLLGRN